MLDNFQLFTYNVRMSSLVPLIASLILSVTYADVALNNHSFPVNFKFGAATSSYQIEGAWNVDGKGENIWDWYTHTFPDKIRNRDNGDVACNSYYKWKEDIELLKGLGVNQYRLSLSWSRILPNGTISNVNQKGIDYYVNILEALLANNIEPLVTLYHWDLPLELHKLGGWSQPILADYFAEYARLCFKVFGKYVKTWITINEPHTTCVQGYGTGQKAPGYVNSSEAVYQCAYVNLLAHAKAYHVYDKEFRKSQNGRVSIALDGAWADPASDKPEDQLAAKTTMAFRIGLYADPIYNGQRWPQIVIDRVGNKSLHEGLPTSRLPKFTTEQIEFIRGTSDFFCLNTYPTHLVKNQNTVNDGIDLGIGVDSVKHPLRGRVVSWVGLVPWGLRNLLNYVRKQYGNNEILVTENGWAEVDSILVSARITYISRYLSVLLDAYYEDGVNVTGYNVWSFLDSFEWTNGYTQRLGIVRVDFDHPDRTRTPKKTYSWYKDVIAKRCLVTNCVNHSI